MTHKGCSRAWLLLLVPLALSSSVSAQREADYQDPAATRSALNRALAEQKAAEKRGIRFEAQARKATEAAERTAREAAALAARIQQSEAGLAAAEARLALIDRQRTVLRARLAREQRPLVRLTASLQKLSRRPLILSVLRPGSLRETVYLRAMLAGAVPQVERRTAALRASIARSKALEQAAREAVAARRGAEAQLLERRRSLAALDARQRLAMRQASGVAAREAERALALAEEARDLDALVDRLDAAGNLREKLAALPGPILRPPRPAESEVVSAAVVSPGIAPAPPPDYQLPVAGRTIAGFGALRDDGIRSDGLTLAPRPGAQVVAPAPGRVAFAGPYRGYGRIVIVEHRGGWISLVTGLARIDVQVGQQLVGGAPLGVVGQGRPTVTLELRRGGKPVNPLEYLG